jgi:sugar (pentulose or hexulose) kinase
MESVAFLLRENAEALRELGMELKCVRSLGGGAKSALWTQIKADVLQLPVSVGSCDEPVALGAAILGAVAAGDFSSASEAAEIMGGSEKIFTPGQNAERYEACYREYLKFNQYSLGESKGKPAPVSRASARSPLPVNSSTAAVRPPPTP